MNGQGRCVASRPTPSTPRAAGASSAGIIGPRTFVFTRPPAPPPPRAVDIRRERDYVLLHPKGDPMKMLRPLIVLLAAVVMLGAAAPSGAPQKRVSPMDVTGTVIDGNRVTIFYSRPYTKD